MTPPIPGSQPRGRGKAVALLLAVYLFGILTGVGGGLFIIQRQVRRVLHGPPEAAAPVDFVFAQFEREIARNAGLTQQERAVLHERMQALSGQFKTSRAHMAVEMRGSIQREIDVVVNRVAPERREKLREVIRQRLNRWGVGQRGVTPGTPASEGSQNL